MTVLGNQVFKKLLSRISHMTSEPEEFCYASYQENQNKILQVSLDIT